jgi:hypothetical protein
MPQMFLRFPTATVATRWQDACFAPLRFLLWHGLRTMPLLRPKVSSSPDYFRDIDSVSRSALSGRQWDAVWVAKTGTWRMHREQKRRPSVRRAWRGLETTPQRGGWLGRQAGMPAAHCPQGCGQNVEEASSLFVPLGLQDLARSARKQRGWKPRLLWRKATLSPPTRAGIRGS